MPEFQYPFCITHNSTTGNWQLIFSSAKAETHAAGALARTAAGGAAHG